MTGRLLEIEDLSLAFHTPHGLAHVVRGVSLEVERGQIRGVVGESGSGKSVTARAVLGLNPRGSVASQGGDILYRGRSLTSLSERQMRREIRGRQISMVFQDPMTALNPVAKIGTQLTLPLRKRNGLAKREADARAVELLRQVGLSHAAERMDAYPHELSGGQRQRVMIAIALALEPSLLIADEPTTALDVTVQAQIMDLLSRLRHELGLAILLISHDLSLIAERCDEVSVMYAGRVVETAQAGEIFISPAHPYTALLERARPRIENEPHQWLETIGGLPPDLARLPAGCAFAERCPRSVDHCAVHEPVLDRSHHGGSVACWRPLEVGSPALDADGSDHKRASDDADAVHEVEESMRTGGPR